MTAPSVSLVVIQYGDVGYLESLLDSLERHPDAAVIDEVVVVNNGDSLTTATQEDLAGRSLPVHYHENAAESYASGVNLGADRAAGDILIVSNNDIEWLADHSVRPLIDQVTEEGVGIAGPQQVYPDGSWQRSYWRLPSVVEALASVAFLDTLESAIHSLLFSLDRTPEMRPGYVDGAFMCIDRPCFDGVGGFDEAFSFYGEDADFCSRARDAGWGVVFEPAAQIMHVRGATSSAEDAAAYVRELVGAKSTIVERRRGAAVARRYERVLTLAYCERALVYSLVARLYDGWDARARAARERCRGVRSVGEDRSRDPAGDDA